MCLLETSKPQSKASRLTSSVAAAAGASRDGLTTRKRPRFTSLPGKGWGSLNGPEREGFPCFQAGIPVIKKVKLTVVIGSGKRYLFSEPQGPERTEVLIKFDLDEYPVLAALLSDSKDFGGNGSHRCHFLV